MGWCNKPSKLQFLSIFIKVNFDALQTLLITRGQPYNLVSCFLGDLWSTSSNTYQEVEIEKETSTKMDVNLEYWILISDP